MKKAAQLLSNGEQLGLNKGYLTSDRENNELYTPFYAVDHIMKYLPKDKIVWLPFDEEWSAFYQRLKEMEYKVIRSSLRDGQDFFEYEPTEWDIIVSNPPFSLKNEILKRLYSFDKPFAVLLPLTTLQGKQRFKFFEKGIQLLTFDTRIRFHNQNYMNKVINSNMTSFATAYFCRDLLPKDLILEELHEYERKLK